MRQSDDFGMLPEAKELQDYSPLGNYDMINDKLLKSKLNHEKIFFYDIDY